MGMWSQVMDGTTIGAVFAAAVSAHGDARSWPCRQMRTAAICRRASRFPTARPASASMSWRRLYRAGRLRPRPSRGDAAGEPSRAHPAQAGAQQHRRVLRADQSRLPCRRDGLPHRAQRARPRPDARRARRRRCAEALAQSAHRPPVVVSERVRGIAGEGARAARHGDAPRPRRRPASSTPRAPPGRPKGCILSHGYEVAVRRLVRLARRRWPACAPARSASTTRCRSITPTPASCR